MPLHTYIQLADDEWEHDYKRPYSIMKFVAEEELKDGAYVVEVREHTGWWLRYAMINGEVKIIGSANDQAAFNDQGVRNFWEEMKKSRQKIGLTSGSTEGCTMRLLSDIAKVSPPILG